MMAPDGPPPQVVASDTPSLGKGLDTVAPRCVKGIIDIPEDIVVHHRDLVGRVLEVLMQQWGLGAVEVHVGASYEEASGLTNANPLQRLKVAGHSFPFALAHC